MFLHNYKLEFFHQELKQHLLTQDGLMIRKNVNRDLCIGNIMVQKCWETLLILTDPSIQIHFPTEFLSLLFQFSKYMLVFHFHI